MAYCGLNAILTADIEQRLKTADAAEKKGGAKLFVVLKVRHSHTATAVFVLLICNLAEAAAAQVSQSAVGNSGKILGACLFRKNQYLTFKC